VALKQSLVLIVGAVGLGASMPEGCHPAGVSAANE